MYSNSVLCIFETAVTDITRQVSADLDDVHRARRRPVRGLGPGVDPGEPRVGLPLQALFPGQDDMPRGPCTAQHGLLNSLSALEHCKQALLQEGHSMFFKDTLDC